MATVWDGRTLQKYLVQLSDFWKYLRQSLHQRLSQKNLKADAANYRHWQTLPGGYKSKSSACSLLHITFLIILVQSSIRQGLSLSELAPERKRKRKDGSKTIFYLTKLASKKSIRKT
ncbi:hypothetical protein TESG_05097 [Trichophyton tonsurans CBS 112818]|uniref:Uncharacterized protein n=1 Tax=Trichophyton tonsurans (strain CBS 112818) TaxID=647933 RepID=F2S296_TRIT1|nr:hypothetical protein TESG_05097 [Trichophyton tonsurans CBS 112818]